MTTASFGSQLSGYNHLRTLYFLLTPDPSASRRVRRLVAENRATTGVVVGTWTELLALAQRCHVLPLHEDEWANRLTGAVAAATGAFWADSLHNVPAEAATITERIGRQLAVLLEAAGPDRPLATLPTTGLSPRLAARLADFAALHAGMGGVLPPDLAAIRAILDAPPERQLRPLRVCHLPEWPPLNPWQRRLIAALNERAPADQLTDMGELLQSAMATPAAVPESAIGFLQRALFSLPTATVPLDETVQCLAVRDYLQEVEIAAGMVQTALRETPSLTPADFALLLPDDERYHAAAETVFALAGIPLANPGGVRPVRDLGGEAVLNLLLSLNKPAPLLALASLLASPLMPWGCSEGHRLAREIVKSNFKVKPADGSRPAAAMLDAVLSPVADAGALQRRLKRFATLLDGRKEQKRHAERATALCHDLAGILEAGGHVIPWTELLARVSVAPLAAEESALVAREAVAVFSEGEEPWRGVRRLFVLGCCEGHYPVPLATSPIFSAADIATLREVANLEIETAERRNERLRRVFLRQLGSASEAVTCLVPRRDPFGKVLAPSAALVFAARLFSGVDDVEKLIVELASEDGLARARGFPSAPGHRVAAAALPELTELRFSKNLLELGMRPDGSLKPESPSRLEKLMVAPLAWLFERLGIEARDWQPETLDIIAQGTLAHAVFEELFVPGKQLPTAQNIEAKVPDLFIGALQSITPFLLRDEWRVEREHLKAGILKAALGWGEILRDVGVEILATEIPLQGDLDGLPIHGNADLLLALTHDRLLVVDYKKSSSKGRRTRMKAGYDHQAELYRRMIRTGGPKAPERAPVGLVDRLALFRNAGEIGTLYYLMNDRKALADTDHWLPGGTGCIEEMAANTSAAALALIRQRLAEVRGGHVDLRLIASEKELKETRGLGVYALDSSPLVRLHVREGKTAQ